MATRSYQQRGRAEAAEATRRRILDAVRTCLRDEPALPVSVDKVAQLAGVARSTVYVVFGSRAGLFDALGTDLLETTAYDELLEAVALPDAAAHLRGALRAGVMMFAADRDVARALFSMGQLDRAAVGEALDRFDADRAGGVAYLARRLDEQGLLRDDVDVERATELLWILSSFDAFDALYTGRGMTAEEAADSLVAAAERGLLREPAR